MNKFKFGDRVRHPELGVCVICMIAGREDEKYIRIMNNDGKDLILSHRSVFLNTNISILELIPHPDTARLNYIDDYCAEVDFVSQYDTLTVQNDYCRVKNPINSKYYQGLSVRQAIDNAMQSEQSE